MKTFGDKAARRENIKAKAIDRLIFANMSPVKQYFFTWSRFMFYKRIKEAGERMKAWYILAQYTKKHKEKEIKSL